MTYHDALWASIQQIATNNHISRYAMAKICDLDSTTFNPSKKYTAHGQARWISTETLAKILINTNTTPVQFAEIFQSFLDAPDAKK